MRRPHRRHQPLQEGACFLAGNILLLIIIPIILFLSYYLIPFACPLLFQPYVLCIGSIRGTCQHVGDDFIRFLVQRPRHCDEIMSPF